LGRPPFRADHIGSLLRPAGLRQAFRQRAAGTIDAAAFERILEDSIRDAVRLQQELGFGIVTDGEFRRGSYWSGFVEALDGLSVGDALFQFRDDHGHESGFTAPLVVGHVRRTRPVALDEYNFLRGAARVMAKITLPAPSTLHFWRGRAYAEPGLYVDPAAFFRDLGAVYRAEIADLAAAGCRYVQLDEVAIAMLCDPAARRTVAAAGDDPDALVDLYIAAINDAVAARPAGMLIGLHLCRGNFKGRYLAEGGYESVAERLFQGAAVDHFLLEFDTPRAGDFAPLRFLTKDKGVVLGLISSKTAALEPLDLLRRRVDEASRFVALDRMAVSPQCGFASTVAGNPVTEADERAKLGLVVAAAHAIWGREEGHDR
jgi:5-methyltetrahydropteroyltriglutamate--homocysteine methyltransferase